MKFKKKEVFLGVLLGTGLNLLNSLRERLPDNLDDIKDRVRDTYGTASDRVGRASGALRGKKDSHILGNVGALLIGLGVGVGVGLLIAPASGDDTRAKLPEKVSEFGDKVREHAGKKSVERDWYLRQIEKSRTQDGFGLKCVPMSPTRSLSGGTRRQIGGEQLDQSLRRLLQGTARSRAFLNLPNRCNRAKPSTTSCHIQSA
jgi:hypothetical protein